MAKTIVIINRNVIASNKKHNKQDAPISIRRGKNGKPHYQSEYVFDGRGKIVYSPDKPLKCGATVWLEIDEKV